MTVEEIIPNRCSSSYGHPSGHTLNITAYAVFVFLDFWHNE